MLRKHIGKSVKKAAKHVEAMLQRTNQLRNLTPNELQNHPSILFALRMSTAPPIARDRLIGLADVSKSLINNMELKQRLPPRMKKTTLDANLRRIARMITRLADVDIYPWLGEDRDPTDEEVYRAATIVADRICSAASVNSVRLAGTIEQLLALADYLERQGYYEKVCLGSKWFGHYEPGTFSVFPEIAVAMGKHAFVPVDALIHPLKSRGEGLPVVIQCESCSSRSETARRCNAHREMRHWLRATYGDQLPFVLLLSGRFESDFLGTQAAEGIDWIWQHRLDDLKTLGI